VSKEDQELLKAVLSLAATEKSEILDALRLAVSARDSQGADEARPLIAQATARADQTEKKAADYFREGEVMTALMLMRSVAEAFEEALGASETATLKRLKKYTDFEQEQGYPNPKCVPVSGWLVAGCRLLVAGCFRHADCRLPLSSLLHQHE
jgi:hypothetical protein